MKIIEADAVHRVLNFEDLIPALRETFAGPAGMPQRRVFSLDENKSHSDAFAILPAWNQHAIGVKAFTYFPENPAKGYESLYSKILLFSRQTGEPMALVDGTSITYWRTAAVSALAADFLARKDAKTLLLCGTGRLAPYMALAHASIRPIEYIKVWGRNPEKVAATIEKIKAKRPDLSVSPVTDLGQTTQKADIISCATGAGEPLILGDCVQPGTHTDFVGNHDTHRRECDSSLVAKAKLFVDSRVNVMAEAGELLIPIGEGRISEADVQAELADLCRNNHPGRKDEREITLFKSVGTALSDLTGATLVFDKVV